MQCSVASSQQKTKRTETIFVDEYQNKIKNAPHYDNQKCGW